MCHVVKCTLFCYCEDFPLSCFSIVVPHKLFSHELGHFHKRKKKQKKNNNNNNKTQPVSLADFLACCAGCVKITLGVEWHFPEKRRAAESGARASHPAAAFVLVHRPPPPFCCILDGTRPRRIKTWLLKELSNQRNLNLCGFLFGVEAVCREGEEQ